MIYLNNAATSYPKPKPVIKAVGKSISAIPFHASRVGFDDDKEDVANSCRKNIAKLFNIKNPNTISFTSGATESLNLAFLGLDLKNKHVITTESEHNSVIRPLKTLERDKNLELSFATSNKYGIVETSSIENLIQNNTALIAINHCSNVTGNLNDIEAIGKICKDKDILFLVDASQSAGAIPIDIENSLIDILVFTGHKSLFGTSGIGGIYIRENLDITPLKVGGTGIRSDLLFQPNERPILFEAGTPNTLGITALSKGVEFILDKGLDTIIEEEKENMNYLLSSLNKIDNITLYGNYNAEVRSPIVSLNIKGVDPEDVGFILESSFDIIVRSGLHCAPLIHKSLKTYPKGSVRLSLSYFTTKEEIDSFIVAIKQIVEMNS